MACIKVNHMMSTRMFSCHRVFAARGAFTGPRSRDAKVPPRPRYYRWLVNTFFLVALYDRE